MAEQDRLTSTGVYQYATQSMIATTGDTMRPIITIKLSQELKKQRHAIAAADSEEGSWGQFRFDIPQPLVMT